MLSHARALAVPFPGYHVLSPHLYLQNLMYTSKPRLRSVCSVSPFLDKLSKISPLSLKHTLPCYVSSSHCLLPYFVVVYTHHFLPDCMHFVGRDCAWSIFVFPHCLLQCLSYNMCSINISSLDAYSLIICTIFSAQ